MAEDPKRFPHSAHGSFSRISLKWVFKASNPQFQSELQLHIHRLTYHELRILMATNVLKPSLQNMQIYEFALKPSLPNLHDGNKLKAKVSNHEMIRIPNQSEDQN